MIKILNTKDTNFTSDFNAILKRADEDFSSLIPGVLEELHKIKKNGTSAIIANVKKYDNWNPKDFDDLKIDFNKAEDAYKKLDSKIKDSLQIAFDRIYEFHALSKPKSFIHTDSLGNITGAQVSALERVGIYIPGGKAFYPSTILMNAIPAIVAGVKNIVCFNPAHNNIENELNLATLFLCNLQESYKIGGISAVGMAAFGINEHNNEIFKKVDLITGPGNIYVAIAKKLVFGDVNIDMIAGPSEIGILADKNANADFLALDMLSQAEHDEMASSLLITDDENLAHKVKISIENIINNLHRKEIATKSVQNRGAIIITKNMDEAINLMEQIAPEHLEIATTNAFEIMPIIKNAGAIFLGQYTPEAMGDYLAGPNHTLPTGGSARFFSPLSVEHFCKKSSIIHISKNGMKNLGGHCANLAHLEGLQAHQLSVIARLQEINDK